MSTWIETTNKLIKENTLSQTKKSLFEKTGKYTTKTTPLEVVEAVTGWLNTHLTEYTEGSSEGASRRVVWLFDNGWMLVIGNGMYPLITHLEKELFVNDKLPVELKESDWLFEPATNGWEWWGHDATAEEILDLINKFSKDFGTPKLILPFESRIMNAEDYTEEEYVEYLDEGTEKYDVSKTFYHFLKFINNKDFNRVSPWEVVVCYEDEYMPYYCDYNRFFRMTQELEEKGWLVIIDEHCAACASGSRKYAYENDPKMKSAPEFMTWGQNSQSSWMPDGKIYSQQWIEDEEHIKQLIEIADKHGFEIDENVTFDSF